MKKDDTKEVSEEFLKEFDRRRKEHMEKERILKKELRETATKAAAEIKNIIKTECPEAKVYLYGSLARGYDFSKHSDIDILVENFSGDYWRVVSEALNIAKPIDVSIACREDCRESFLKEVDKDKIELK